MTKLGQLELKRKNKTEAQFMPVDRMNIFSVTLSNRAANMERELEDNKKIFSSEVEKMSDEDRLLFYENKHNVEILPADRAANASEREKRKLRKRARSMAKKSNGRYVKLRKKVFDLARDYSVRKNPAGENFSVKRIEGFKTPSSYSKEQKRKVATLKNNAGKCYARYLSMKCLYTDMENGDSENVEVFNMVANEYEIAYAEWKHMKSLADCLCSVSVKELSEDEKKEGKAKNKRSEEELWEYSPEKVVFNHGFDEQIKKKYIDWDVDFDNEIQKLELEKNGISGNKRDEFDYDVEINTLKVKKFVKGEMEKLIEENKQQGKNLTVSKIEKDVNAYLKKVTDKCELRFRCPYEAVLGILGGKMHSGNYDELMKKWYSSKAKESTSNLFTFGYCGGDDATEYQGIDNDNLNVYGYFSVKLNKEKFEDSTSVIVGNSHGNYEKQKGRDLQNPDILAVGNNLRSVYNRAQEVKKGAKLLSAEQEANIVSKYDRKTYFECHFRKTIEASGISEITYMFNREEINDPEMNFERYIQNNKDIREIYSFVKYINANPKDFGREGLEPLKLSVWTNDGKTFDFEDMKYILEKAPALKK